MSLSYERPPSWAEVRSMMLDYEVVRDGPRLRVVLPDVVPPDWDSLERDLRSEIEDGATRILVCAGAIEGPEEADDRLISLIQSFAGEGIDAVAVWHDSSMFAPHVSVVPPLP
jgi:hypothetical protein